MQHSTAIDDSYIDDYSFGREGGDDMLLLIVASVTPTIEQDEETPEDSERNPIYASQEDYTLTEAGTRYASRKISQLIDALARPFNDDDCTYGGEYHESCIDSPLRFISPREKKGCILETAINWIPLGGDQCDEQEAIVFFDLTDSDYKTAFFIALSRGDDPSAYLLYWDHIGPYLSPFTFANIAAYNDNEMCVTMQDYHKGEINDEHDATYAAQWMGKLSLTKKEISAIKQVKYAEEESEEPTDALLKANSTLQAKPLLRGRDLLDVINSGQFTEKIELAKACGYTSTTADGREIVNYTAFFEAKTKALSSSESYD